MSRTVTFSVLVVCVTMAAILLPGAVWTAVAQDQSRPMGNMGERAEQASDAGMAQDDAKTCPVAATEAMKMRCRMMMKMEVTSHDPAALLALKDHLKLTAEQTKRLEAIVAQTREETAQVLTDEQKTQLQPLEKLPKNMVGMHQQLVEKMGKAKGGKMGKAKGGMKAQMPCPMMEMTEMKDNERPAAEKPEAKRPAVKESDNE